MAKYEFTPTQNKFIARLGNSMRLMAITLALAGLLLLVLVTVLALNNQTFELLSFAEPVLMLVAGIVFYRPIDNLYRATNTEGHDIEELMTSFRELRNGLDLVGIVGIVLVVVRLLTLIT